MKDDKTTQGQDLEPRADSNVIAPGSPSARVDNSRRTLLKKAGVTTVTFAFAVDLIPKKWQQPSIETVLLPLHAQTSPGMTTVTVTEYSLSQDTRQEGGSTLRIVIHTITLSGPVVPDTTFSVDLTFGSTTEAFIKVFSGDTMRIADIVLPDGVGVYTSVLTRSDNPNVEIPSDKATRTITII